MRVLLLLLMWWGVGGCGRVVASDDVDAGVLALCENQSCSGHGNCSVVAGEPVCECESGYVAVALVCELEDLCVECDLDAECIEMTGEFTCICNAGFSGDGSSCEPDVFTVAVLGDTQGYVDDNKNVADQSRAQGFINQVEWILENRDEANIQFVSHVGDVVEHDTDTEWARSRLALDAMFSVPELPWSVTVGNHDVAPGTIDGSKYLENFGPQKFTASPWYGGSDQGFRGTGLGLNSFQIIGPSTRPYLHLNIEVNADDQAIAWAQSIVDAHLGMPTMLSTHEFLNDQRDGSHPQSNSQTVAVIASPQMRFIGKNSATRLWNKLIAPNSQIFLTFNGHYCCEREMVQNNDEGFPVLHVQVNYSVDFQGVIRADAGWIRLLEIDEAAQEIRLRTTKPPVPLQNQALDNPLPGSLVRYPMTWRGRFGRRTMQFQEGVAGYASTEDVWFSERDFEQSPIITEQYMRTALFPQSTVNQQGILKFGELIGEGAQQIPVGATVVSASLNLVVPSDIVSSEGEPNAIHQMLVDWTESAASFNAQPWAGGLTGMIDRDGVEATRLPGANVAQFADNGFEDPNTELSPQGQGLHYDVTDIVQDWATHQDNFGLLLQSLGTGQGDALFMASSDYTGADADARPKLSVALKQGRTLQFRHGQDGYFSGSDTWISSQTPNASEDSQEFLQCISESGTEQILIQFQDIIGASENQLPLGATVHSARLIMTASPQMFAGSNGIHALHPMLRSWEDTETFASFGAGIQFDGIEASVAAESNVLGAIVDNGRVSFDVTASVQSWVSSGENHGWILQQISGDNRLFLASQEATEVTFRPRLLVQFTVE